MSALRFDLFNGDADGILARHQYRLSHPDPDVILVSGVKRDVKLLKQVLAHEAYASQASSGLELSVFDISMESNAPELSKIQEQPHRVIWFDHHRSGDVESTNALELHIDLSPKICTGLLVDQYLDGAHRPWALAAAYGDNLSDVAEPLALASGFDDSQCAKLRMLGEALNYNGYGESLSDLCASPLVVARDLERFDCPFEYLEKSEICASILEQKSSDESEMGQAEILHLSTSGEAMLLPDSAASRRMSGLLSNQKVYEEPDLAHAMLTVLSDGSGYRISIRSPKSKPFGADVLASQFPTGGGRAGAAGINALPKGRLEDFFKAFDEVFSC